MRIECTFRKIIIIIIIIIIRRRRNSPKFGAFLCNKLLRRRYRGASELFLEVRARTHSVHLVFTIPSPRHTVMTGTSWMMPDALSDRQENCGTHIRTFISDIHIESTGIAPWTAEWIALQIEIAELHHCRSHRRKLRHRDALTECYRPVAWSSVPALRQAASENSKCDFFLSP